MNLAQQGLQKQALSDENLRHAASFCNPRIEQRLHSLAFDSSATASRIKRRVRISNRIIELESNL